MHLSPVTVVIATERGREGAGRQAGFLYVGSGGDVQNWEAELGSHWSSRTMEGSLLAPLMNSSRDNLPTQMHG